MMEVNESGVPWQMKALLLSPDPPRQHKHWAARGDDSQRFLLLILCSGGNRPAPFVETGALCVQPVTCLKHKAPNGEWIRNPLLLLSGDSENQRLCLVMSIFWSHFFSLFLPSVGSLRAKLEIPSSPLDHADSKQNCWCFTFGNERTAWWLDPQGFAAQLMLDRNGEKNNFCVTSI